MLLASLLLRAAGRGGASPNVSLRRDSHVAYDARCDTYLYLYLYLSANAVSVSERRERLTAHRLISPRPPPEDESCGWRHPVGRELSGPGTRYVGYGEARYA